MRSRALVVLLLAALSPLVACGDDGDAAPSPSSTTTPTTAASVDASATTTPTTAGPAFEPAPIEWDGCGGGLECARLAVPLDYDDPAGPTIELALNRSRARVGDQRIGALLFNPGGPGASALPYTGSLPFADAVLDRFDIVGFDPRGVGDSAAPACGDTTVDDLRAADPDPDSAAEATELDAAAEAVADDCATNAGAILPHMGTDDVVRDMDTIRRALGEQTISYIGFSYGTFIGLRALELMPTGLRAVVLDGVVDPTQGFAAFLQAQTVALDRSLSTAFAACPDGDGDCPDGGSAAAYDTLAARVETDPLDGGDLPDVGPGRLATAAIQATYSSNGASKLADALSAGLDGDGRLLAGMAGSYESSVRYASYAAVVCLDSVHPVGSAEFRAFADDLREVSLRFGGTVANEMLPCAYWPAAPSSTVGPVDGAGGPPVLVIGTTGDAATPYEQAERVATGLVDASLLTFVSEGHTAYGESACVDGVVSDYLIGGALPPAPVTCER